MKNMNNFYTFIFCVPSKIESHTGLKLHEGEEMMTTFTSKKLFLLMLGVFILDPAWGAAKNNDVFKVKGKNGWHIKYCTKKLYMLIQRPCGSAVLF